MDMTWTFLSASLFRIKTIIYVFPVELLASAFTLSSEQQGRKQLREERPRGKIFFNHKKEEEKKRVYFHAKKSISYTARTI